MVGKNLQILRKELKLSREKFGERIFVSGDVINNIERERANPNPRVIAAICQEYGINEHWLRTGEGEMYVETPASMLDRLADEKHMGPGGRFLMKAVLRVYEELGEDKCIEMIYDLLPEVQNELETIDINRAIAEQENASELSSQESVQ